MIPTGSVTPALLAAVAGGGALGALARYGLATAWPATPGSVPWSTLVTNLAGCFLIGFLMQLVTTHPRPHRLLRPFLGAGVLGGFTTFSIQSLEVRDLLAAGRPWLASGYAAGTLVGALSAVWLGRAFARPVAIRLAARA
ncbi:fluoride efflux transporter FluC [Solwaraspora sp. WMMB335]|uniref:fluoride efflux transporter FluC n=1 Tax=Solwaraspora sp. WMMB335 TaxID=3404118 RepID=UPI003B960EC2